MQRFHISSDTRTKTDQSGRWLAASERVAKAHCVEVRPGAINAPVAVAVASIVVMALLLFALMNPPRAPRPASEPQSMGSASKTSSKPPQIESDNRKPLLVYCAASNKGVVEQIRADYAAECGVDVQVQYGASQSLLTSIELTKSGDVYIPADSTYLKMARERKLLQDELPIGEMKVVIAVPKGNPKQILSFADLLRPDIRLAQGNPETAAIGALTRNALAALNKWEDLKEQTTVFKTSVNDVANDIRVSAVDAGIVYDVTLRDYAGLEAVVVPELSDIRAHVAIGVLADSQHPASAVRFARFVSARNKGLQRYAEWGFSVVDGPEWTETADTVGQRSVDKSNESPNMSGSPAQPQGISTSGGSSTNE